MWRHTQSEYQRNYANQSATNIIPLSPAEVRKIASFYKIYLASKQSKITFEQISTCGTDQSATIGWYDYLESHDLSAELQLLFNDSSETGNDPKSTASCTLLTISIQKNPTFNQLDGQIHQRTVHNDISEARANWINKMPSPLTIIPREVSLNFFNISTHKNSFGSAELFRFHLILIYLTLSFEFNFSIEAVSNRIYLSQVQPNWKSRKRKIGHAFFFLRQFIHIDDNQFCHSYSDDEISILVNINSVALSFTMI